MENPCPVNLPSAPFAILKTTRSGGGPGGARVPCHVPARSCPNSVPAADNTTASVAINLSFIRSLLMLARLLRNDLYGRLPKRSFLHRRIQNINLKDVLAGLYGPQWKRKLERDCLGFRVHALGYGVC